MSEVYTPPYRNLEFDAWLKGFQRDHPGNYADHTIMGKYLRKAYEAGKRAAKKEVKPAEPATWYTPLIIRRE